MKNNLNVVKKVSKQIPLQDDFIGVYDNVLTKEQCSNFISFFENLRKTGFTTPHQLENHRIDMEEYNDSWHYDLNAATPVSDTFFNVTSQCVNEYLKKYTVLGQSRFLFYDFKLKKIPVGGGFHDWHFENSTVISCARQLVIQIYLSDIEEGGETEFLYLNKRVKSKAGRLIIFPAGYTHVHRGNPPIGQEKYIATTWGILQSS
tara:strand:- start:3799 stop:4410 length:612 start_codon:yes stop_codon:yes gene_type:complete